MVGVAEVTSAWNDGKPIEITARRGYGSNEKEDGRARAGVGCGKCMTERWIVIADDQREG